MQSRVGLMFAKFTQFHAKNDMAFVAKSHYFHFCHPARLLQQLPGSGIFGKTPSG